MGAHKVTEMEYTTIKQLLGKGHDGQKVAMIVGRSVGTVSAIRCSANYDEYISKQRTYRIARRSRKVAVQPRLKLPEATPDTTIDLRQSIVIKLSTLYDEVLLYKRTPTGKTTEEQRDLALAVTKLEEAEMWLKRHW